MIPFKDFLVESNSNTIKKFIENKSDSVLAYLLSMASQNRKDKLSLEDFSTAKIINNAFSNTKEDGKDDHTFLTRVINVRNEFNATEPKKIGFLNQLLGIFK